MKLILPISFLVISVGLFFLVIDPSYLEIKELNANIATYNTALSNSTDLQKTRDSLIGTYKNIKIEDKDRLEHLLPSSVNNIELILEIEKIANLKNMVIKDIKFDTKDSGSTEEADTNNPTGDQEAPKTTEVVSAKSKVESLPYGIFEMEFKVEGKYDTFVSFLKEIEHNLRLVDMKSISFTVPKQESEKTNTQTTTKEGKAVDPNIYTYTLKIQTYWLK
jgi:hypothetical protein